MKKHFIIVSLWAISLLAFAPPPSVDMSDDFKEGYFFYAPLTEETLRDAIAFAGVSSGEWVMAQALLESGSFKSNLCQNHNNLFGMKKPAVRRSTATGRTDNGFATYECWYDAVKDMRLFQQYYRARGIDLNDYAYFLSERYAEDVWYVYKLKKLM